VCDVALNQTTTRMINHVTSCAVRWWVMWVWTKWYIFRYSLYLTCLKG